MLPVSRAGFPPVFRKHWLLQRRLRLVAAGVAAVLAAVPLVWLTLQQAIYGMAVVYVLAFLSAAWRWPHVALMLIFASAPFQADVSGGGGPKFSITEVNLALTLPVFYLQGLKRKGLVFTTGPLTLPVILYFLVCLYSSSQNWLGAAAVTSFFQMFNYMVLAVAMFATFSDRCERNLLSLNALVVVGVLLAAYKLSGAGFLGLHKNGIGASLACTLIVGIELWFAAANKPGRQNWLLAALLIITAAMISTLSRGAWLSATVGMLVIFSMRREWRQLRRIALVLVPLIVLCWYYLPQADRDYATGFSKSRYNIQLRYASIDIARRHYERHPVYGDGVGWRKLYDATNTPMLLLAETGILGLLSFLLIHIVFYRMVWQTQRRLERTDPAYSFLAVGAALLLGKLTHGMVDHYWSRGAVTLAWSSVGMALGTYYYVKSRQYLHAMQGESLLSQIEEIRR
jgi:hypothetical protein